MKQKELDNILADHWLWLTGSGGKQANLRGANLQEADLRGANLRGADLQEANLRDADLQEADLQEANLRWANLQEADLQEANLRWANLRGANLQWANLQEADLQGANLQEANLQWANLQGADLQGANLRGANLREAKIDGVKANEMTAGFWPVCPDEGSFTAFKKLADDKIAKLFIPEHAKRSSATTRKCRCSEAIVVAITDDKGDKVGVGYSQYAGQNGERAVYTVGHKVYPDAFDEDRWNECSNGIHFFMTRREAELY